MFREARIKTKKAANLEGLPLLFAHNAIELKKLTSSLSDAGFFTCKVAEIEDSGSAYGTALVDIDLLDERGSEGENSFHTDAVGNLTNSKGFSRTTSGTLKNDTLEILDTLFVAFLDFIMDSDGISGLEFGERFALDQTLYELHDFCFSHDL